MHRRPRRLPAGPRLLGRRFAGGPIGLHCESRVRQDRAMTAATVRDATAEDAAACAAIYAPYVTDTAVTFETEPPSEAEIARRITQAARTHAWLVAEDDGHV